MEGVGGEWERISSSGQFETQGNGEDCQKEKVQVVHDTPEMENVTEDGKQGLDYSRTEYPSNISSSVTPQPALAEETVCLNWSSPFSLSPRCYTFEYANIKFFWEGTRDVHSNRWAQWFMPFCHLKLIARIPGIESEDILIGQYTASFATRKFGELWIFDSAVAKLLGHHSPWAGQTAASERDVRETRLHELIMTTAICMIIGERGKRNTLVFLLTLAAEGGGGAG
ncbi:hypothetical protein N7491_009760 [Penicillium cf. griseofulvum]|nr:hypothetical protein N7491_009760 [Penicillium cf. griseofulvum]